jgi:FKBP-type peptidyl-prolyl cis-trans isomerase
MTRQPENGFPDMIKPRHRVLTGLLTGALGMSLAAQEPEKPATEPAKATEAADPFQAPDNVAAPPAEAEKTESGLASLVLRKGTGTENPKATDTVKVHYTGWKASDGEMFDSSLKRGQPASFPLNQVIKGWTEGVQLMVVGEKRRFWIPADLAYGENGRVAGDLTFDVELIEIVKAPEPPETPKDLIAPADALETESGLKSKILKAGEGEDMPGPEDVVTVEFSGWKADGEFLTSTQGNDRPAQFKLDQLSVAGWTEGLQLMKKGEKRRFWIPAKLAFGEEGEAPQGAPTGDLVFDFELVDFQAAPKPPPPPKDPNAPDDVAAPPEGASKTESGIAYTVLGEGKGEGSPGDDDLVKVNFTGWDANGASLGSNKTMGGPMTVFLDDAPVTGWVEILKGMKAGERRRVWIPQELTAPAIPDRGTLTFDLELVSFKPKPAEPETPEDVAGPPEEAKKTPSGLAYKVLQEGTGDRKPTAQDRVKVHYSGWTTDGEMFDSSVVRDDLFEFSLAGGVIEGWLEAVKLMVEGEKTRFWIPVDLAYKNLPDRPAGMLVFDIELVEIVTPPRPKRAEAVSPPVEVIPPKPEEKDSPEKE